MKIPFSKDDSKSKTKSEDDDDSECCRMTMSGAPTDRKDLVYEIRETSLLSNAVTKCGMVDKAVQSEPTMDIGGGDPVVDSTLASSNFTNHDESNYSYSNSNSVHESFVKESASPLTSSPLLPRGVHRPGENISETVNLQNHADRVEAKNLTQAIVEDNQTQQPPPSNEPRCKINQSDPTVPALSEHSKTSTLRLSDRTRSESEDDIEKMEESEPDGDLGHAFSSSKAGLKAAGTNAEKRESNGEKDKNEDWRPSEQEDETDCTVQCLYYTIQCCECTIL